MNRLFPDTTVALPVLLRDGLTIACGRFGLSGIPERLLYEVRDSGARDSTFASDNAESTPNAWGSCIPDCTLPLTGKIVKGVAAKATRCIRENSQWHYAS